MILGLASPTYAGAMPEANPLHWLLDRCVEYELGAMEASLPLEGGEDPGELGRRAADAGIQWIGYWSADFVTPEGAGADSRRGRNGVRRGRWGWSEDGGGLWGGRQAQPVYPGTRSERTAAANSRSSRPGGGGCWRARPATGSVAAPGLPRWRGGAGNGAGGPSRTAPPAPPPARLPLGKGMALEVFAPGVKVGVDDHRSSILRARRSCEMPVNP